MTKKETTITEMNMTIVALVAVVAIVGLVALVMNAAPTSYETSSQTTQTLSAYDEEALILELDEQGNVLGMKTVRPRPGGPVRR